jgi:hypothetical protein
MLNILRSYNITNDALPPVGKETNPQPAGKEVIKYVYAEAALDLPGSGVNALDEGDILQLCEIPNWKDPQHAGQLEQHLSGIIVISFFGMLTAKELIGVDFQDKSIEVISCETGGYEEIEFDSINEAYAVLAVQRSVSNHQNDIDYGESFFNTDAKTGGYRSKN